MADRVIQSLVYKLIADETELVEGLKASSKEIKNLESSLLDVDKRAQVWGATSDDLAEKQRILKDEINKLISQGVDPAGKQITAMKDAYDQLGKELDEAGKESRDLEEKTRKLKEEQELAAKAAQAHADKIKKMADGMISAGKKMTLGLTAPIVAAGTAMVMAAAESEKAMGLLENAIGAVGNQGKVSAKNLAAYASELQLVSVYDDEATISAFTLLEQMTALDEDGLKALMPSIQNLASALGMDLQSATSLVAKTIGSDTNALGRYGIEVDASASKSEKMAQVLKGLAKYQGSAAAEAATFSGKMSILKNQVGDLAEQFGNELLPILSEVVTALGGVVKEFAAMSPEQKRVILTTMAITAAIGPMLIGLGNAIKAMSSLKIVMSAMSGPAGWATLAAGAFVLMAAKGIEIDDRMKKMTKNATAFTTAQIQAQLSMEKQLLASGKRGSMNATELKQQEEVVKKLQDELETRKWAAVQAAYTAEADKKAAEEAGKNAKSEEEKSIAAKSYADSLGVATSAIEGNKTEQQKIIEQIKILEKLKTASAEDEKTRLSGIAILREQLFALQKKEEEDIEADRVARREKDIQYNEDLKKLGKELADKGFEDREKAAKDKQKKSKDEIDLIGKALGIITSISDAMQTSIEDGWDELTESILDSVAGIAEDSGDYLTAGILKATSGVIDIIASWIDYAKKVALDYAETTNEINKSILDNKIEALDDELAATIATIDAEEQAALEAAGLADKTTLEKLQDQLADETDEEERAELEKEIAKAKIQEEYQAKRDAAEAAAEVERKKLEHDRAVWEREIMLAQIAVEREAALAELGWFNQDKKAGVNALYDNLIASVNAIPIPALAHGGSFVVPPGFENDSFPITTAMAQSGERVTVETPEQAASGGATFQIGTVIADPAGLRDLERLLNKYGTIEKQRRG